MSDFAAFLAEIGVTQQQMDSAAMAMPDPVVVEDDKHHSIEPSDIQGVGVFSGSNMVAGDHVCQLKNGEHWTVCGRYINHDLSPNTLAVLSGDTVSAVAAKEIFAGEELTINYRQIMGILQ